MSFSTLTLATFFLTSSLAWAGNISSHQESMACGTQQITIGMTTDQIKTTCGQYWQPAFISKHSRPVLRKVADSTITTDEFEKWLYRVVENQETHVVIKNGMVVKIFNTPQPQ